MKNNIYKSLILFLLGLINVNVTGQTFLRTVDSLKVELIRNDSQIYFQEERKGLKDITYKKYTQYHKGVPVFGSALTQHLKNNISKRVSGYYIPNLDIDVEPLLSKDQALEIAMHYMGAEEYNWEVTSESYIEKNNDTSEPKLVIIDQAFPATSDKNLLAYQVDLYSKKPLDKRRYFIDALSGYIITDLPLLMQHSVPGSGITKYYGEQLITIDSIGPNEYALYDQSRGNGNAVLDEDGSLLTHNSKFWDIFQLNNNYVGVDAHYCTQKFYDFMLEKFNWNGLDNSGKSMNSKVHIGNLINAFWDGNIASFGDGGCHHGPLTTLEVVAHEFMHGITQHTSKLVYSSESGAINESLSDIFGVGLEFFENAENFQWSVGHTFLESEYGEIFRSFEDPNIFNHPKMYKGQYWLDDGDVHINSSVGNHWFYLLVNGGHGVNETGYMYNIKGIGMEDALQLVFQVQSNILVPNSDYNFYAEACIAMAEDIFGTNSRMKNDVVEAWKAVGLPFENTTENFIDLGLQVKERFIKRCLNNEFYPLEFKVKNTGNVTYTQDMGASIIIQNFGTIGDTTIFISETLNPGESLIFKLDSYVLLTDTNTESFFFTLNFFDSNKFNNFENISIDNSIQSSNNLRIKNKESLFVNMLTCFNQYVEVDIPLVNEGCIPISKGETFRLLFYDEDKLISNQLYALPVQLESNDVISFSETIDRLQISTGKLNIVLEYNNQQVDRRTIQLSSSVFNDQFSQGFDTFYIPGINFNSTQFSIFPFEYEGNNYFATCGATSPKTSDFLCSNLDDQFYEDSPFIEMCIDTRFLSEPVISFDLIQFRNEDVVEYDKFKQNTNFVKLTWSDGNNNFEDIIIGQPEGSLIHHEYELPENAQGTLKLHFFNNFSTNSLFSLNEEDYESSDLTLLDNLTLAGKPKGDNDLDALDFEIFPNPSSDFIIIESVKQVESVSITNLHGQEILNRKIPNLAKFEIDTNFLVSGVYIITLIYEDGAKSRLFTKI